MSEPILERPLGAGRAAQLHSGQPPPYAEAGCRPSRPKRPLLPVRVLFLQLLTCYASLQPGRPCCTCHPGV